MYLARRQVTLRDRERAVLDDLLRQRRDSAGLRLRDLDLDADGLALRREPADRDLLRIAFLVAAERRIFL